MDAWIKKVESGEKWSQLKISDERFARICKEWKDVQVQTKKRDEKYFSEIFYRKDVNMMAPLPGGRVGGLASPVKKYKMAQKQLGRTKYTTPPVNERGQWDPRFSVRTERSTQLFCDKKWPPKLTVDEENDLAMLEIGDKYAAMNITFPHKKATNTGNTSVQGGAGNLNAIADDEDEYEHGSPKSAPAYSALDDVEARSAKRAEGSSSRGSVRTGYPDESLLRAGGAKLEEVDGTTSHKSESTLDMTEFFRAVHGRIPVPTVSELAIWIHSRVLDRTHPRTPASCSGSSPLTYSPHNFIILGKHRTPHTAHRTHRLQRRSAGGSGKARSASSSRPGGAAPPRTI